MFSVEPVPIFIEMLHEVLDVYLECLKTDFQIKHWWKFQREDAQWIALGKDRENNYIGCAKRGFS